MAGKRVCVAGTLSVVAASVASVAMLGAVCVAPTNAAASPAHTAATTTATAPTSAATPAPATSAFRTQPAADSSDTALESADAMPENPHAALPDKVSAKIADDATVVSEQYAITGDGELKDIESGEMVTDPKIVGTESTQPDPLAKTDGESFIPVSAADVKEKVAANGGNAEAGAGEGDANGGKVNAGVGSADEPAQSDATTVTPSGYTRVANGATSATAARVTQAALQNNEYGAYWGSYNGTPAFFESNGNLFAQQAKGAIDVSTWQGTIDWQAAKNAGVEGAIIRLSYGWGNGFDAQARRNINECKRLGIPFGVYVFSYAESASDGASEGADVVSLLRQAGVAPGDLSYPVFYDLERWSYTGHVSPTSPAVYEGMVNAWYGQLQSAGYTNLSVYSYTSYLDSALNSASIHAKTRWVAQYGARMQYTAFPTNDRGWQYTSSGRINGISGSVDLNAFGVKTVSNGGLDPNSGWRTIDGKRYWFDNGVMARNKQALDPATGKWYWFDADGSMARGVRRIPDGAGYKWVYYDVSTGEMRYGEQYLSYDAEHTGWYYFDPASGAMTHGVFWLTSNGGKWVYYDINTGQMRYGEQRLSYNRDHTGWYYFDEHTGAMAHGVRWLASSDGKWVYYHMGTGQMQYGEQRLSYDREHTGWYYFDKATGAMAHGWVTLPDSRRVFYNRQSGKMVYGWQTIDGHRYYFNTADGALER